MKKILALPAILLLLIFSMSPGIADTHGQNETSDMVSQVTGETTPAESPYQPPPSGGGGIIVPSNEPPVADAGPDRTVYVNVIIHFNGAESHDPDGNIDMYHWFFGDGGYESGVNVSHAYSEPGNYTVSLSVVDNNGATGTDNCTVTVRETSPLPPPPPPPPLPPILDNLTITPAEIELGNNVTISFDIMNIDNQSISYMVDMQIGELTFPIDIELEAYESKTISRTIFPGAVGEHNVTVHGMTGSFTVEPEAEPEPEPEPAEFVVSGLTITREPLEFWCWEFKIAANVTNIGEQEGTHTVALKLDGLEVDWRTVKLGGGETTTIVYSVTSGVGSFPFEVEGLTGSLEIESLPGPTFEFSNLRIFIPGVIPPEVERDQTVTVTVSIEVENVGELEGGCTVELKMDGEVIDSKEVTLEGGGSATVLFELTRGEGTYEVEVEGFTESFTIELAEKTPFWMQPIYVAGILIVIISAGAIYILRRRAVS